MHAISRFGYISDKIKIAPSPRRKICDVLVVEELAVTPHCNASSSQWRAARAINRTSLCFSPYLPVASLNFSLDYWRSHRGRRPQAEAAQVLISSRYRNSSSHEFYS